MDLTHEHEENQPTQVFFSIFCAVCPKAWKEGLVLCLLHRAKAVCSSVKFFKTEVDNLRRLCMKNNYPIHFFNKILERFLHQPDTQTPTENEPDPKILFKVPFAGKISKDFFNSIRLIIKIKSNLHYTRRITPKRVTSCGAHFRGLAPGQHSSEETSQRWRVVGDTVSI